MSKERIMIPTEIGKIGVRKKQRGYRKKTGKGQTQQIRAWCPEWQDGRRPARLAWSRPVLSKDTQQDQEWRLLWIHEELNQKGHIERANLHCCKFLQSSLIQGILLPPSQCGPHHTATAYLIVGNSNQAQ